MTNDGNFNINNLNTVEIPIIANAITYPGMSSHGIHAYSHMTYFYDSNYFYTNGQDLGGFYRAPIDDIFNGEQILNSQPGAYAELINYIHPTPINGYYYGFCTSDAFGIDIGGEIFRAPEDQPLCWYQTGTSTFNDVSKPMVYVNGTHIYLIGGRLSGSPVDTIDYAPLSTLVFVNGGTLPAERLNGTIVTVGSTIYMYGGVDLSETDIDTIYSASTATPDVWTDTLDTLPAPLHGAAGYNDGTYIYLFGGNSGGVDVNTIYRAPVGTPTTFTSVGTIPATGKNFEVFVQGAYLYLLGPARYRAALADLLTWTTVANELSYAVRESNIFTIDDTIYAVGGYTDSSAVEVTKTDKIQTASTSNPLQWTDLGAVLPTTLGGGQLIKTRNYLYMFAAGTGGNYYKASVSAPAVWTLAGTNGPTTKNGRVMVFNGEVYYIGGDFAPGVASQYILSAGIDSSSSPTGDISFSWKEDSSSYHDMALPIGLTRFALIASGQYVYVLGGSTGAAMNTTIYRNDMLNSNEGWVLVGSLGSPLVDSTVVVINNYVYLLGGGPTVARTTSDNYCTSASMSDLANGVANFVEEDSAGLVNTEAGATVVDDNVYFFGGRSATAATKTINRTYVKATHALILPRTPETTHSIPTIDLKSGALGSYTSYQRTGLLPWVVTDI